MTSPVAVVGLTWDGYDVQRSDLDVFLEITEGLDELPDLRSFQQIVPFRHGRRADVPYADKRAIVLTGLLSGPSATERAGYRGYVDEVKGSFSPLRDTPGTLVATLEDGTTRWIKAMPLDMRTKPIVPGAANASIELIADDPFWYSANGFATMDSGLVMDDGEVMDQGAVVVVTPTSTSEAVALDTLGTADVERIRVHMTGPSVSPPGIEVDTPDGLVGFALAAPLISGQELTVDNFARTALIGVLSQREGMTLKAANRHGEYVRLRPGVNAVRVLGQPAQARILFTPTWL